MRRVGIIIHFLPVLVDISAFAVDRSRAPPLMFPTGFHYEAARFGGATTLVRRVLLCTAFGMMVAGVGAQSGEKLTTITWTIVGATGATNVSLDFAFPANFTLWNEYPVVLSDTLYSVMASYLNGVVPGTTPTPGRRVDNTTGAAQEDESMKWYWIALIVVGGAVGVTAIVLAIYFGVMANKANKGPAAIPLLPNNPVIPPPTEPAGCIASFVSATYPSTSGGRYAKVIQVPIVCPRTPGTVVGGHTFDRDPHLQSA